MYGGEVPRLWNETIASHRATVQETIMETAWRLVSAQGLTSVTMSQIAQESGIGRATLYKYFPDVDAILVAWHDGQVATHLDRLTAVRDEHAEPGPRLRAVLTGYARMRRHRGGHADDLTSFLHRDPHTDSAQQRLRSLVTDLIAEAAAAGAVRADLPPGQLAGYALHALGAADDMPGPAAVDGLVDLVATGLGLTG
jgi:AcrR family transcriptional regulator